MNQKLLIYLMMIMLPVLSFAQGVAINTDNSNPDASAILDVKSTNQGVLVPRMTDAQKTAIPVPAIGLLIYQTDGSAGFWYFDGTIWQPIAGGGGSTLDAAYDFGGAGLGRNITADAGVVAINGLDGFLTTGTYGSGLAIGAANGIPAGAGTRMFFNPAKAAFRAGEVSGTEWDDVNVGAYSIAMGRNTSALGDYSTAMGSFTTASGNFSTAMGRNTSALDQNSTAMGDYTVAAGAVSTAMGYYSVASGLISTAFGNSTEASGDYSTVMGTGTRASGFASTAIGSGTVASGQYSTAMGSFTTASGLYSTAMGNSTTASGQYSTAMGLYASTNGFSGSFVYGDNSTASVMNSTLDNQFSVRAAGGYRLFSNSSLTAGVQMFPGAGGWASVSDKNKKENFKALDGADVLSKIKAMPITEWNYLSQDKSVRHVGPMAQDFYAAFGLGGVGNDTTITTSDIDGINMAAIQALAFENEALKAENVAIKAKLEAMEAKSATTNANFNSLKAELEESRKYIEDSRKQLDEIKALLNQTANK